ncbi:hypothetical protein PFICI_14641 [Pestalotiopsis fici W106-1]|uniref:Rhodopsin domain-containing protein n=1 Tax=Pestalotiopsis fici (strain W106-1 / CGMCC3.15140) TaxID=1229662 RepID=W3WIE2_PESFW|nr:uncharacterized protein PFICI_14641 [Pestalotiopsis fici W106-1]ETS73695.1 hypothetical protein PFICI_14641 [Pestalotiopsis fici W106-1]
MSDEEDRSRGVLGVAITFLALTWIVVPLRIYVRTVVTKAFGTDDVLLLITQALFTTYLSAQLGGWYWGTGRHRDNLTPEANTNALRFWFICEIFYVLTATFIKLAVGLFLIRLSVIKMHIWFLRILMVGSVVFGFAYLMVVLFQCRPISTFWLEAPGTPGKCLDNNPVAITTYIASVVNCLADWAFGILPMFIVWSLNMNKRSRIIAMGILGFASIASTATIVRCFYIKDMLNGQDFLWATTNFAIWSTVEPGVGIIATSIATLRPILRGFLALFGISTTSRSRATPWTPSRGYIKTDDQSISNLRPDIGASTSTAAGGPRRQAQNNYAEDEHSTSDLIELSGIVRTVEVSLSRDNDDVTPQPILVGSKAYQ